jgi:hypothetical protein
MTDRSVSIKVAKGALNSLARGTDHFFVLLFAGFCLFSSLSLRMTVEIGLGFLVFSRVSQWFGVLGLLCFAPLYPYLTTW